MQYSECHCLSSVWQKQPNGVAVDEVHDVVVMITIFLWFTSLALKRNY